MRIGGEAPGGGPILSVGIGATSTTGSRHLGSSTGSPVVDASSERRAGKEMILRGLLACRTQGDTVQWLANGDKSPECDEQLARQGDDHCLARGATMIGRAGLGPLGQSAVVLQSHRAPGELDHRTAERRVTGCGKPSCPPLGA